MLLRALISLASNAVGDKITPNRINIEINKINPALKNEFGPNCSIFQLSPNQRNRILRDDLGFTVKSSHGRQRIYLTIPQLIKACEENNIQDDCFEGWKEMLGISNSGHHSETGTEEAHRTDWETEE